MWRRRRRRFEPNHDTPVPDGDQVLVDGAKRWADLLPDPQVIAEPTMLLPVVTPAARHRSRGRR